jgi:hypothetical protein
MKSNNEERGERIGGPTITRDAVQEQKLMYSLLKWTLIGCGLYLLMHWLELPMRGRRRAIDQITNPSFEVDRRSSSLKAR